MFKVSTLNLSPDGTTADASFGKRECGELDSSALAALLDGFSRIDAVQNHEHDPQVLAQTRDNKYLIRTSGGKLHLYNARNSSQPGAELTLPALLEALGSTTPVMFDSDTREPESLESAPAKSKSRGSLAAGLLLLGVALNAWGVYQFLHREEDPPPPTYTLVTDQVQVSILQRQLAGTFVTGNEAGDRMITISSNGTIKFHLLAADAGGALVPTGESVDTFDVGRRSSGLHCLVTANSDQVDIGADGSLLYFGDTYWRAAPAK